MKQLLHLGELLRERDNVLPEGGHPGVLAPATLPQIADVDLHVQQRDKHPFDEHRLHLPLWNVAALLRPGGGGVSHVSTWFGYVATMRNDCVGSGS